MKNYLEMAADVLRRAEEERQAARRRRRRRLLLLACIPAACAVLALAILLWPKHGPEAQDPQSLAQPPQQTELAQLSRPGQSAEEGLAAELGALGLQSSAVAAPVFAAADEPKMLAQDLSRAVNANPTIRAVITDMDVARTETGRGEIWYFARLTLSVREVLTGSAPDELRVLCAAVYSGTDGGAVPIAQLADCREGTEAVFVLRAWDPGVVLTVGETDVRPAGLGDFRILYRLEQDGRELRYEPQRLSFRYLPAIAPPEPGAEADMIGLVVYRGAVYTQVRDYFGADAEALRGLLGERLGRASGSIDEGSTQDDYAVDFAATVYGDVYTLDGYDPGFRLCVTNTVQSADGGGQLWIQVLERLNGIGLSSGAELFSDRLRVDGRIATLRCQSYDAWNTGREDYRPVEQDAAMDAFLAALNEGEWVYVYGDDPGFYRNTRSQVFLDLELEDGTAAELRLIEGGWVGYQGLSWYAIRLPAEVFDPVFNILTSE